MVGLQIFVVDFFGHVPEMGRNVASFGPDGQNRVTCGHPVELIASGLAGMFHLGTLPIKWFLL